MMGEFQFFFLLFYSPVFSRDSEISFIVKNKPKMQQVGKSTVLNEV